MSKKRSKPVSFDAMVKLFVQRYRIPTTKDVDRIVERIDKLESAIRALQKSQGNRTSIRQTLKDPKADKRILATASEMVLETISQFKNGAGIPEIRERTGYGDKKLRNIIYRLNSTGKITRITRGKYIIS